MKQKEFETLLEALSISSTLRYSEMVKWVYILRAWKLLSEDDSIQDNNLKFEAFYYSRIEYEKLIRKFKALSKNFNVFKLFLSLSQSMSTVENRELETFCGLVDSTQSYPKVTDIFYTQKMGNNDYTISDQIAKFGIELLNSNNKSLYVPFTNGFAYAYHTKHKIYAEHQDSFNAFVAELMNILDNCDIVFHLTDAIGNPSFINPDAPHLLLQYESVLSFPPFSVRKKMDTVADKFNRFHTHKGAILDVAHFEHILSQTKSKAVVLMPVGFTYRSGTEEKFRQYIVDNNYLEAIVQLPPNLHSATAIETTFFVINKQKDDTQIHFISLKDEQFLKKEGRQIVFKDINEIVDIYRKKKEMDNIATFVDNQKIMQCNYSLAIDRYVISKEAEALQERLTTYEMVSLEEIAEVRRSQLFKDEDEGREIYELSPSDLAKSGYTTEAGKVKQILSQEKRYETYKLLPYDILLSTKGTIGKVGIIGEIKKPMVASQALEIIRLRHVDNVHEKAIELYMFFKSDLGQSILKQLVAGVAMPQIATSEVKKLQIPLLSSQEKSKVMNNFRQEIEMYEKIESIAEQIEQIHSHYLGEK